LQRSSGSADLGRSDPALEVRWRCREHAAESREARHQAHETLRLARAEYAELAAAIALLPPAVRAELHEQALRGVLVRKAGDLMYWFALRRAYDALQGQRSLIYP
jgi:hypothetical protein